MVTMPTKTTNRKSRAKRSSPKKANREERLEALPRAELLRRVDDAASHFAAVIKKSIKAA